MRQIKKIVVSMMLVMACMTFMACGSSKEQGTKASSDGSLQTPVVKDGVTSMGEDSILVVFEWDKIDGADGYEVSEENKYCTEETYREPETSETTESSFTTGAQDDFDFRIKVRAYKGAGDVRQYSDWSEYALGSTYDKN